MMDLPLGLAFAHPGLLLALLALPLLWLLLRAVPPAPLRLRFAAVVLLLGLEDRRNQAVRTPWWLILLRALGLAAAIIGFAGPVLAPPDRAAGQGPLLILLDGGWGDAPDWAQRQDRAKAALDEAARAARPVALASLTDPATPPVFQDPADLQARLAALQPKALAPQMQDWVRNLGEAGFQTLWLADGLDHPGREDLAQALLAKGALSVVVPERALLALRPPSYADDRIILTALRAQGGATPAMEAEIRAIGPDPSGIERELARVTASFAQGASRAEASLALPPELRNRVQRFEILGQGHAGAVSLADDRIKRRKVAVIAGGAAREGLQILDPGHFLRQALGPTADLMQGSLRDVIPARPDVIVLADVARLAPAEVEALTQWVEKGGLLLRFAGPRMAAAGGAEGTGGADGLLPVRLRAGGRDLGGAMSWGEAKPLAPFAEGSLFHGLALPADVTVRQQLLAEPDPDLARRTLATLSDGTPLVTRKLLGQGQIVLFHVTANADWSNLPLSGLFPQMLERLAIASGGQMDRGALQGQLWAPDRLLDGFGALRSPTSETGVPGEALAQAIALGGGAAVPPGLYLSEGRRVAANVIGSDSAGLTAAIWPPGTWVEGLAAPMPRDLAGWFLALALLVLSADILASLWVAGRLGRRRAGGALALVLALPLAAGIADPGARPAMAQDLSAEAAGIAATRGVSLAYVRTGNAGVDQVSAAGLQGLSDQLWYRTSVEPEPPTGVDLETDELAFFPFLYWPITPDQPIPSPAAYAKLNGFLRSGGMILFDTRDADLAESGTDMTPEAQMLQLLAQGLDIPPLERLPQDHILTRTFYILGDLPGRFAAGPVWVEYSPPAEAAQTDDQPSALRNANDGVTPVIIGGNDWASAWAVDQYGVAMFPVGGGYSGEQQREYAFRAGINIVMHVLTGNYKSDQVHVPALLERLGQ